MLTLARPRKAPRIRCGPKQTTRAASCACSITECVRNTVDQLGTVAAFRGVRITVPGMAGEDLPVPLAADDCSLLISNLLLNALQHSFAKSMVDLRLNSWGQAVELVIEDHGEGISSEALPHVFERFYRGDPFAHPLHRRRRARPRYLQGRWLKKPAEPSPSPASRARAPPSRVRLPVASASAGRNRQGTYRVRGNERTTVPLGAPIFANVAQF